MYFVDTLCLFLTKTKSLGKLIGALKMLINMPNPHLSIFQTSTMSKLSTYTISIGEFSINMLTIGVVLKIPYVFYRFIRRLSKFNDRHKRAFAGAKTGKKKNSLLATNTDICADPLKSKTLGKAIYRQIVFDKD